MYVSVHNAEMKMLLLVVVNVKRIRDHSHIKATTSSLIISTNRNCNQDENGKGWKTVVGVQVLCFIFYFQVVILAAFFTVALTAPQQARDADAVIVKYDSDNIGVDGYNFAYVITKNHGLKN